MKYVLVAIVSVVASAGAWADPVLMLDEARDIGILWTGWHADHR